MRPLVKNAPLSESARASNYPADASCGEMVWRENEKRRRKRGAVLFLTKADLPTAIDPATAAFDIAIAPGIVAKKRHFLEPAATPIESLGNYIAIADITT